MGKVQLLPPVAERAEYYSLVHDTESNIEDYEFFTGNPMSTPKLLDIVNNEIFSKKAPHIAKMLVFITECHIARTQKGVSQNLKPEEIKASAFTSAVFYSMATADMRQKLFAGDTLEVETAQRLVRVLLKHKIDQPLFDALNGLYFPMDFIEYIPDEEIVTPSQD